MQESNSEDEQEAGLTSKLNSKTPASAHIAAVFRGVATMTREFEKCPRGSQVTERLLYFAMACVAIVVVTVAFIRIGH